MKPWLLGALLTWLIFGGRAAMSAIEPNGASPTVGTYSIVAFDLKTGDLGVAVQSKFFGVGSVVPWAKARVGAIATQSAANTTYGPRGLALLQTGKSAAEVALSLTDADSGRDIRQLGIVDARGRTATFTGAKCQPWAGHVSGENFCAQGNILAGEEVVCAMAAAYTAAQKTAGSELADWLVAALNAAEQAGGDRRGRQSAALLVVREGAGYARLNDRYVDLRVEDHPQPVEELARLLDKHKQFYSGAHRAPPKPSSPPAVLAEEKLDLPRQFDDSIGKFSITELVFLVIVGFIILAIRAPTPAGLGVSGGRLAACPNRPNCVNSQAADPRHAIAPLPLAQPVALAKDDLKRTVARLPRARLICELDGYLHYEFTTAIFRLTDDVEFFFDESGGAIHVRSVSRVGHLDLGANRKRIEILRRMMTAEPGQPLSGLPDSPPLGE